MLYCSHARGLTEPNWTAPWADSLAPISEDEIQGSIDKKNDRISSYRQSVRPEALWLLIINGLALSSMFDQAAVDALGQEYRSEFSRTFIFNWLGQTYSEIKTQPVAFRAEIKADSSPEAAPDL